MTSQQPIPVSVVVVVVVKLANRDFAKTRDALAVNGN